MTDRRDITIKTFTADGPCLCGSKVRYDRCCGVLRKNSQGGGFTVSLPLSNSTERRTHFAIIRSIFEIKTEEDLFYKMEDGTIPVFTEEVQAWQLQQRLLLTATNPLAFGVARMTAEKFANFERDFVGKYILVPPTQASS